MKSTALLLLCSLLSLLCVAQSSNTFLIKAGSSIGETIPAKEIYEYPGFKKGMVYFRSGDKSEAQLNYHRLLDEIQFINSNNDTMALANEELIKLVTIGTDSFFWNKGFVKLIRAIGTTKLAHKQSLRMIDVKKRSAYDISSSVSSISTISSVSSGNRRINLALKQDVLIAKDSAYYFGDRNNRFLTANRKNLMELFPKNREQVKTYLNENNVVYTDKNSLEKLLEFLASL